MEDSITSYQPASRNQAVFHNLIGYKLFPENNLDLSPGSRHSYGVWIPPVLHERCLSYHSSLKWLAKLLDLMINSTDTILAGESMKQRAQAQMIEADPRLFLSGDPYRHGSRIKGKNKGFIYECKVSASRLNLRLPVGDSLDWRRTLALKYLNQSNGQSNHVKSFEVVDMASVSSNDPVIFTEGTRVAFLQHLRDNPSNRRLSQSDKDILIEWLLNPNKQPASQEEFGRRYYVRKSFFFDVKSQTLLALAKKDEVKNRIVITTDMIAEVVEFVHKQSGAEGHGGLDRTWKDVRTSYYGILRSDVIFLVKQCQICADNPSKRPKGSTATISQSKQETDQGLVDSLDTEDEQFDSSALDNLESNKRESES